MMKRLFLAAIVATFAAGSALADDTCESKAVGKDGKALAGAAKTSFMKKCTTDACETKAVSADGKKLSGAAKNSFMKKCQSGA
jgi:opacity protein-like surface antigen